MQALQRQQRQISASRPPSKPAHDYLILRSLRSRRLEGWATPGLPAILRDAAKRPLLRMRKASARHTPPSCMDGPLSARLFLVFWQTDRGAVMYVRPPVGKAFCGVLRPGSGRCHVWAALCRQGFFWRVGNRIGERSCMDGPLSARLFLVFWQTDRGAVMYGRPPVGKAFFGVLANGSGSGH